jgi:hypothetical protein
MQEANDNTVSQANLLRKAQDLLAHESNILQPNIIITIDCDNEKKIPQIKLQLSCGVT